MATPCQGQNRDTHSCHPPLCMGETTRGSVLLKGSKKFIWEEQGLNAFAALRLSIESEDQREHNKALEKGKRTP